MCCTGHTLECWLGSYRNVPRWSTYSSLSPTDTLGGERERLVLSTESVSPFLPFSCPRLQSILTSGRISSPLQGVLACLRLLTTRNLFLLSFVFLYSGTSLSILTTLHFHLPLLRYFSFDSYNSTLSSFSTQASKRPSGPEPSPQVSASPYSCRAGRWCVRSRKQ